MRKTQFVEPTLYYNVIPTKSWSLEQSMEFLADDELLEVTPKNLRIRKRILDHGQRMKALKGHKAQ